MMMSLQAAKVRKKALWQKKPAHFLPSAAKRPCASRYPVCITIAMYLIEKLMFHGEKPYERGFSTFVPKRVY